MPCLHGFPLPETKLIHPVFRIINNHKKAPLSAKQKAGVFISSDGKLCRFRGVPVIPSEQERQNNYCGELPSIAHSQLII